MQLDSFLGKLGVIFCGVCEQTAVCVLGEGGLFEQGVPLGPPGLARSHRLYRRRNYGPQTANIVAGDPESTGNILQQHPTPPLICPSHFTPHLPPSTVEGAAAALRHRQGAHSRELCPLARAPGCVTRHRERAKHWHPPQQTDRPLAPRGGDELSPPFFSTFALRLDMAAGNFYNQTTARNSNVPQRRWSRLISFGIGSGYCPFSGYLPFLVTSLSWLLPFKQSRGT